MRSGKEFELVCHRNIAINNAHSQHDPCASGAHQSVRSKRVFCGSIFMDISVSGESKKWQQQIIT